MKCSTNTNKSMRVMFECPPTFGYVDVWVILFWGEGTKIRSECMERDIFKEKER